MLLNGEANEPSPSGAADLSTKTVRGVEAAEPFDGAATRNQKLNTPPGTPSASPSIAVGTISG